MTLRHRLLLVYGIVVLLSVATVAVALFELERARRVFGALQHWHGIVLTAQKLRSSIPTEEEITVEDVRGILDAVVSQYPRISYASDYIDADIPRESLNVVRKEVTRLQQDMETGVRPDSQRLENVRFAIDTYANIVEAEGQMLENDLERQESRKELLLLVVFAITGLHIAVIGSLLRRWLLRPMEQLNRQVQALARDEPAPEPLLTSPREMATLATALDQARESLGTLRQKLIDSERLTTIGQFAAQLAHNLRNPLAGIRAMAQVTGRLSTTDAETRQRMQEIVASVDRLNHWIAGLMEVARREPAPTPSADVVPLLHRIREALATEVSAKELTLHVDAPQEGLVCAHDPATLEHALIAMVVNAIEASPLGAEIRMTAERVVGRSGEPACRICVHDHGCGLPANDPERIFEFWYSTKQRGMGLGLGLARQALQRQGGSTHALNNPDGGATVYVELPLREADNAGRTPNADSESHESRTDVVSHAQASDR